MSGCRAQDVPAFSPLTLDGSAPLVVAAPAHLVNAALAPETWLTERERADIGRYRRAQDRADRFAAWGLARLLAGRLTGQPPAALAVSRSPGGRPQLTQGGADFNLSHAGGWVAVGVVRSGFIGVDLEQARSLDIWDAIAPDFLAPPELAAFRALGAEGRAGGALRLWCIKEAVLKAVGEGLGGDPRSVEVNLTGNDGVLLRHGHTFQVEVCEVTSGLCLAWAVTPPAKATLHVLGSGDIDALRRLMPPA